MRGNMILRKNARVPMARDSYSCQDEKKVVCVVQKKKNFPKNALYVTKVGIVSRGSGNISHT